MSHAHTPPQLPDITDEAGDTPGWVPLLGVALFVLLVAYGFWAHSDRETPSPLAPSDAAPAALAP